jgi:hypothetical protein
MADNGHQMPLPPHLELGHRKTVFFIAEGYTFNLSLKFHQHLNTVLDLYFLG